MSVDHSITIASPQTPEFSAGENRGSAERNKNAWLRELEKAQSGLARATGAAAERGQGGFSSGQASRGAAVSPEVKMPFNSGPKPAFATATREADIPGAVPRASSPATTVPLAQPMPGVGMVAENTALRAAPAAIPRAPVEWAELVRRQIAPRTAHAEWGEAGRLTLWIRDTDLPEAQGVALARRLVRELRNAGASVSSLVVYLNGLPLRAETETLPGKET